jgi:hypothetical protein
MTVRSDDDARESRRSNLQRDRRVRRWFAASAAYSHASCMNWEKKGLTRTLRDFLVRNDDDALYTIACPVVLEEPKPMVSQAAALLGIGAGVIYAGMARSALRHQGDVGNLAYPSVVQRTPMILQTPALSEG